MKEVKACTYCPGSEALTSLSEKHMLPILYALSSGAKGFNDLQENLHINTATLAVRLHKLEEMEIIEKQSCGKDLRCHYYLLTRKGKDVSTLIQKLYKVIN